MIGAGNKQVAIKLALNLFLNWKIHLKLWNKTGRPNSVCEKVIFCYHVFCCEVNVLKVMQNKTHLFYSKVCSVSLLLQSPVSVTNNMDKYFSSLTFQLKYRHLKTQLREENGMWTDWRQYHCQCIILSKQKSMSNNSDLWIHIVVLWSNLLSEFNEY